MLLFIDVMRAETAENSHYGQQCESLAIQSKTHVYYAKHAAINMHTEDKVVLLERPSITKMAARIAVL
jgi:hypothetical protein